jgi:hypothetical protein
MVTTIQPMTGYTPPAPPTVPSTVPKAAGFNFLPPGTVAVHDGGKWGLYYYAAYNVSYMVYDFGDFWRINTVLGKLKVGYAKGIVAQKPCCQED